MKTENFRLKYLFISILVLGFGISVSAQNGIEVGPSTATGNHTIAAGDGSAANGDHSIAVGDFAQATGDNSAAFGESTHAIGDRSFAFGFSTNAGGIGSTAGGQGCTANGASSVAMGINSITNAAASYSISLGAAAQCSGYASTALGESSHAIGARSLAFGFSTNAGGIGSTAGGQASTANGENSVAIGLNNITHTGAYGSLALGTGNQSFGANAIALGESNMAVGNRAVAIGQSTTANGSNSLALGNVTTADAEGSIAGGFGSIALGINSVALGVNTKTEATAIGSVALGGASRTIGDGSFAAGQENVAHAFAETAIGQYCEEYTGYTSSFSKVLTDRLFVVGNGDNSGARSNALTMLKSGFTGLGTSSPTTVLDVHGQSNTTPAGLFTAPGKGVQANVTSGSATHTTYGFFTATTGAGDSYGAYLDGSGSHAGPNYGSYNRADNSHASGIAYGTFSDVSGTSRRIGVYAEDNGVGNSFIGMMGKANSNADYGVYSMGKLACHNPADSNGMVMFHAGNLAQWRLEDANGNQSHGIDMGSSGFEPWNDNDLTLGTGSYRWIEVYAVNGVINTSDGRLKKNIEQVAYGLDAINKLRPVTYSWKNDDSNAPKIGFIAQEMERVIPEIVVKSETGTNPDKSNAKANLSDAYGMRYTDLIPVLTKGIQELSAENDVLKARLARLEKMVETLSK